MDVTQKAKITYDINAWLNTPTVTHDKKKTKKTLCDKIEIFQQLADATDDQYWKDLFVLFANNKIPKPLTYKDGRLLHKKVNNVTYYDIQKDANIYDTLYDIIQFLHGHGYKSPTDIESEEANMYEEERELAWSEIVRKRKLLDIYVFDYVMTLQKNYNLTEFMTKDLLYKLRIGFSIGIFKEIDYRNGAIQSINGISFDGKTFVIDPNLYTERKVIKSKYVKTGKNAYITPWKNFLNDIDANSSQNVDDISTVFI